MAHLPSPAERKGKTARPTTSCHGKSNNLIQTEVLHYNCSHSQTVIVSISRPLLSLCQHQGHTVIVSASRPGCHCVFNIKARPSPSLCVQHQGQTAIVSTSRPYCRCVNIKALLSLCQHQGHTVIVLTSRPDCHCVNIKAILSLC